MKFGFSTNLTWHGAPVTETAMLAERLGFESMWMGEHIVIPAEVSNPKLHVVSAVPTEYRNMAEPVVWLTAAAVATSTIKLGFNICLVPQRHPILMAKQIASLDRISNGRVLFGAGAGWIEEEAAVFGYPLQERWSRTMENLRIVRKLWTEDPVGFDGEFIRFDPIHCYPKPVQQPHVPILIGSGGPGMNNSYALKRVAELADGWIPCFLSPDEMTVELHKLRGFCAERGRDFDEMDITIVLPASQLGVGDDFESQGALEVVPVDPEKLIDDYRAAGVDRIVLGLVDLTEANYVDVLERAAAVMAMATPGDAAA
ncbi:MAG: TIGR03619 family F420-dependent LLM class oxidoreductase [Novosphingobium sp.]|nr:TIGR03619 family F420-dependent LLM class oxidoreductase [Novosphingobium sp.]